MASCLIKVPLSGPSFFRSSASLHGQASPSTSKSAQLSLRSTWLGCRQTFGRSRSAIRHQHRSAVVALFGGHVKVSEINSPSDLLQQLTHVAGDIGSHAKSVFESRPPAADSGYPANADAEAGAFLQDVTSRLASIMHQPLVEDVGSRFASMMHQPTVEEQSGVFLKLKSAVVELSVVAANLDVPHLTLPQTIGAMLLGTVVSTAVLSKVFDAARNGSLPPKYDPKEIQKFFEHRPLEVAARFTHILGQVSVLVGAILLDRRRGDEKRNELLRARQCRELITRLGPTAIKVGQALSIRPDLLPLTYLEELQTLQDRVPPFSNEEAKQLIQEGLGVAAESVFSQLSTEPVAAASLGQVYKGTLRATGEAVAVKVQRPGVLEEISRDLYVLRMLADAAMRFNFVKSDLVAVLDTWAARFFDELDYVQEGRNAIRFQEDMRALQNVTVPKVFPEYTSRKVLTTAWVEGEKLSESKASDVGPLVTTMLNCYLIQLLESGFLHADPHPGNLLRTPEGRLCVLDFGLMTEVTEDQRYALIEYISHIVNGDFEAVAGDLYALGFVPPGMNDPESVAEIIDPLSKVLGQLVKGGGAAKLNINQVTDDLSRMSQKVTFVIPPYFALILRAFGVLEGIGLAADPDYAIVEECYPYLAKRLLTDDSPRARKALRYFLYGSEQQLNVTRVEEISAGFRTFRDLMAPVGPPVTAAQQRTLSGEMDPSTREALNVLFSPQGSYVQDMLLTELVRAADAASRGAIAEWWLRIGVPASLPGAVLANRLGLPVPPIPEPGAWPLPLPGYLLGSTNAVPTAKLTAEDLRTLSTLERLWANLQPSLAEKRSPREASKTIRELIPFVNEFFPGLSYAARRFAWMLFQRQAARLATDLEAATRSPLVQLVDKNDEGTVRRQVVSRG